MAQETSRETPTAPDAGPHHHTGGCHCGAVRFAVEIDLSQTIACNCSICSIKGLILAFAPASAFRLDTGDERLLEYRFNRHVIRHLFCSDCGVEPFARGVTPDGAEMMAVNVRTLDGVDPTTLSPIPYDGRAA